MATKKSVKPRTFVTKKASDQNLSVENIAANTSLDLIKNNFKQGLDTLESNIGELTSIGFKLENTGSGDQGEEKSKEQLPGTITDLNNLVERLSGLNTRLYSQVVKFRELI